MQLRYIIVHPLFLQRLHHFDLQVKFAIDVLLILVYPIPAFVFLRSIHFITHIHRYLVLIHSIHKRLFLPIFKFADSFHITNDFVIVRKSYRRSQHESFNFFVVENSQNFGSLDHQDFGVILDCHDLGRNWILVETLPLKEKVKRLNLMNLKEDTILDSFLETIPV